LGRCAKSSRTWRKSSGLRRKMCIIWTESQWDRLGRWAITVRKWIEYGQ
jgi:hypothetical protein